MDSIYGIRLLYRKVIELPKGQRGLGVMMVGALSTLAGFVWVFAAHLILTKTPDVSLVVKSIALGPGLVGVALGVLFVGIGIVTHWWLMFSKWTGR